MTSTSRLGFAFLAAVGPLVAGCFDPRIQNGAFACEPHDDPPCPTGFYCFNLRCVTDVVGGARSDLGEDDAGMSDLSAGAGDLARAGDLAASAGGDLAHGSQDLTMPPDLKPPPDLAPPPDMATGMCGHAGAPCTSVADCCSNYCRTDGICIGG